MSGDNFKSQSVVFNESSEDFIKTILGQNGSIMERLYTNYGSKFEAWVTEFAKKLFKTLHLYHWNRNVQTALVLVSLVAPLVFVITVAICLLIIFLFNYINKEYYDYNIRTLEEKQRSLTEAIELIKGKKSN